MSDDAAILQSLRSDHPIDAATTAWLARRAAPRDRTLHAAVRGKVEILRDRAGIPHVFASHTQDVYFGLGLAMAEDRLWQMDRLRRRALGQQAEILGPTYAAADLAHLTVGIDLIALREVPLLDPATRTLVDAFVAGINRGIEAMDNTLPVEFGLLGYAPRPFTVADVIATARGFWWSLNGRIDRIIAAEAARLLPEHLRTAYLTPEASENLVLPGLASPEAMAGTDDATGSNNWALAGHRTSSGQPLLAGDPHQPFWVPSSWYEFALHGPDDDAAGCGHPGVPGLWYGSNGTAAWALTNNMASTRDLYREQTDPADPTRYRDGDTWRRFDERTVGIAVRGEPTRTVTVRSTVRGPIVNALVPSIDPGDDAPMSLRWVGMEHLDDLRALIGLGRARSWDGFRTVLRDWSVAVFNWVYADRHGQIGYQMAGRIPIRGRMHPGVREAANPNDQWQGMIPFDGLPSRVDPPAGTVASANQQIVGAGYPYPIYGAYSQGHRGVRLEQAFAAGATFDAARTIALQNDIVSTRAERTRPYLLAALAGSTDPGALAFAAALQDWDCRYTLDSPAPTLFETFMALWNRTILAQHLPAHLLELTVQQSGLATSVLEGATPYAGDLARDIATVAAASIAAVTDRLGPADWSWGRVHQVHWRHPLSTPGNTAAFDIGPVPVDGGSHTLRNTGGELPPHGATSGAEYRIVVDFATPGAFLAVQNIGNSGLPGSPHYRDQLTPWLDGRHHAVPLTRAGVERDLVATTVVTPAPSAGE